MTDENATSESQADGTSRRDFVRSSAAVAMTAPAVALLLSASTRPAVAQQMYANGTPPLNQFFDDFTFGNNAEDIDAIKSGTNLTSFGKPAQDDHNTV